MLGYVVSAVPALAALAAVTVQVLTSTCTCNNTGEQPFVLLFAAANAKQLRCPFDAYRHIHLVLVFPKLLAPHVHAPQTGQSQNLSDHRNVAPQLTCIRSMEHLGGEGSIAGTSSPRTWPRSLQYSGTDYSSTSMSPRVPPMRTPHAKSAPVPRGEQCSTRSE